jgi:phosphatidylinositol phospholipase C gamma-1
VDNNQYLIGSATFDSLTELVQYYESNPLYRRMKLKYAINDEVLKSIGEVRGCGL